MDRETHDVVNMAIGRILRIASRPQQPNDIVEYLHCRALILDALETLDVPPMVAPLPGWNFGGGVSGVIE